MLAATILVPTHTHGETLRYAVGSALRQTLDAFELLIVGDGCDDATRAIALELAASDRRVRFLDFPKGRRKGESHRHAALSEAKGRIVAYLGDDDLWLPHHLETLDGLLAQVDFGHTLHAGLDAQGELFFLASDLDNSDLRNVLVTEGKNRFDFTFGGHTLAAYRRLPGGWHTVPEETPAADLHLWQQFLAQPWCRARTAMVPTGLCSQTHLRPSLAVAERARELAAWTDRMAAPGFREWFEREALAALSRTAVSAAIARDVAEARAGGFAERAANASEQAARASEEVARVSERAAEQAVHATEQAARAAELAALASDEAARAREQDAIRKAIKRSWSWRLTKPVRICQAWLGKTPY